MNESFLHYVWQHQYYALAGLSTEDGRSVTVRFPGVFNQNAGPDFLHARIIIGEIEWNGAVEIHVDAADYYNHGHHKDMVYDQVILHVVWKNNRQIFRTDGTPIPAIELHQRVSRDLLNSYELLAHTINRIPCRSAVNQVPQEIISQMMNHAAEHRLEVKANRVLELHKAADNNWNEAAYRLLASCFGMKINSELFMRVSEALPLRVLQRYANDLTDLESMLFGVAGLLEGLGCHDNYTSELTDRFRHLRRKFELNVVVNSWDWKYHRMRPGNFPTQRLAQLAALLKTSDGIFTRLLQIENFKECEAWLKIQTSDYWVTHYDFGKIKSGSNSGVVGDDFIAHILINVCAPLVAAYAKWTHDELLLERAVRLLKKLPAESNKLIRAWADLGIVPVNAYQSQALIHQMQSNCRQRQCLECMVGTKILQRSVDVNS